MEPKHAKGPLAAKVADLGRLLQANSAAAARLASDPDWRPDCAACDVVSGGVIAFPLDGRPVRIRCPLRADPARCRLAREESASDDVLRAHWLRDRGIAVGYHGARLPQVDPSVRRLVAGYLVRLREHVAAGRGLIVFGRRGTGKTSILALIAAAAYRQQLDCRLVYAWQLYDALCNRGEEAQEFERHARRCRLLLLDDFGQAYEHAFPISRFEGLMEERQAARAATCVTTRLSPATLRTNPDYESTYDRWRASCWAATIPGDDSRRQTLEGEP